jgi:hypothetical protein
VQLVDAHLCTDGGKYLSALLLSLSTMLHLELPQVNVLSKVDLIEQYGTVDFNLDFYTQVCQSPGFFQTNRSAADRLVKLIIALAVRVLMYAHKRSMKQ